jgi:hypothetical protein
MSGSWRDVAVTFTSHLTPIASSDLV